ncbi:hypothetical protein BHF71_00225 [Vulcanibacillus modesticaldus]|uniref:UPF0122 protein BHF71_00225 n=1 Tax=Vulcanibacillus modesticaldus TaxID=337097 RepID=A0A1D2YXI5_9BACI|nr:putative DNA-binding protein [Vulcanibacillus modesticaldus]OEG00370.1 hypothetical protein BHF71_00225 [Vulcanibacillus modesticaldus]
MLEKTTRFIMLYDFYQDLLTEKQKKYAELYYQDDLSLGEIAEEFGISRQAVYEHIKRSEMLLEDYESKLKLLAKHEERKEILNDMEQLLNQLQDDSAQGYTEQLREKITLLRRLD